MSACIVSFLHLMMKYCKLIIYKIERNAYSVNKGWRHCRVEQVPNKSFVFYRTLNFVLVEVLAKIQFTFNKKKFDNFFLNFLNKTNSRYLSTIYFPG